MGKKKEKIFLMAASLLLFCLTAVFGYAKGSGQGLSAQTISQKKWQTIESKTAQIRTEDPLPFSLYFGECALPFDSAQNTFFMPVDPEDPLWENGTLSAGEGANALFLEDFAKISKAKTVAENGSIPFLMVTKEGYAECFVKPVGLPVMELDYSDKGTEAAPLYTMRLLEPAEGGVRETACLTAASLRGNTSMTYDKKSLRLRLKQEKGGGIRKYNASLLSMRKDDDWILNSLYADPSRIRDKLCMDLWMETGAGENPFHTDMGVEGEYVELIISGGYTGLYLLTYPVDRKLLSMDAVSAQLSSGNEPAERIYKKKYSAALMPELFEDAAADPGMPSLRGGYILKGDTVLGTREEWESLRTLSECMQKEDAAFSGEISQIVDPENTMANWLFFQAIGGFDNEYKNHYYVTRRRGDALMGYFIPWDMNLSFGCIYADNEFYSEESDEHAEDLVRFEPGCRIFSLNAAGGADIARSLWKSWRSDAFSEQGIEKRIDALADRLKSSGALEREQLRWPQGNASGDLSHMKDYTRRRLLWLDGLLAETE